MDKKVTEQMIVDETEVVEESVTNDTEREPEIVMLPLAAFVRPNYRFTDETFEDYKRSMKIQGRIRKMIARFGSQHKVGYDTKDIQIYWVMKPNDTLVIPGTRRRFHNGEGRFKDSEDRRRGGRVAGAPGNDSPDVVGDNPRRVSAR